MKTSPSEETQHFLVQWITATSIEWLAGLFLSLLIPSKLDLFLNIVLAQVQLITARSSLLGQWSEFLQGLLHTLHDFFIQAACCNWFAGGEGYHPEEPGESMDGGQPGGPRDNRIGPGHVHWQPKTHQYPGLHLQRCGQAGDSASLLNSLPSGGFWGLSPTAAGCSGTHLSPHKQWAGSSTSYQLESIQQTICCNAEGQGWIVRECYVEECVTE